MNSKTCGDCKHFSCSDEGRCMDDEWTYCDSDACYKFQSKVVTNGDKIRQMNNEEFAKLRVYQCPPVQAEFCKGTDTVKCVKCWLNWLNAPAENEVQNETTSN